MTKKMVLGLLVCAILGVSSGCTQKGKITANSPESNAPRKLFVYNWSYYIAPDVLADFEKKFNCKVVYDIFDSNEQMFTKFKSGATGYDITFPSGDFVSIMAKEGMLEKLDKTQIPNAANIDPAVIAKIKFDQANLYSIPYMMGGTGIAVNKAALAKAGITHYPRDNSIFELAPLKGKITLLDDMREVMGHALKSLGYSVNSTRPEELEKAKQLVLKWKKNILKFDSESFAKLFAQGEVWVVQGYAENVMKELDATAKQNVDFFIPPYGGPMYMDSMVILKDSKNKDLAYKFLNFIHEPVEYAKLIDYLGYPSIDPKANPFIKTNPNYELSQLKNCELKEDLGQNIDVYNKIWQDIRIQN